MASIFDQLTQKDSPLAEEVEPAAEHSEGPSSNEPLRSSRRLRETAQELLKYGLLEESQKPNLYRISLTHAEEIDDILEPLDLAMKVDDVRGLAYVVVRQGEKTAQDEKTEQDDWSHPLVRRQRLNLEQSLLVAILRQYFVAYEQESGVGASGALVAIEELIPQLQIYLGDLGSDAKERTRVLNLLDQLKGHGLVSAPDAQERVTIRPIIAHLANPENLQALLEWLREQVQAEDESK